ncbi:EFCC1 protein, partial [Amia calva]|nr:EFCC1 protein [Amia calva]
MSPSSPRPARKSEWVRSALAHHYHPDPGAENEIVVLATGVDQYLQEIFHHLAYPDGDALVSGEDFRLLCAVLGVPTEGEAEGLEAGDGGEAPGVCAALPRELGFKDFHSRLCGYFRLRARGCGSGSRLLVSEETEHIEREIRLRWPRVRRRKCVSFDLSRDAAAGGTGRRSIRTSGSILKLDKLHRCCGESGEKTDGVDPQVAALTQLEVENASLRELVEDLRAALQGSDARCLALEVALRRDGGRQSTPGETHRTREALEAQGSPGWRGTRALLKELELIRASRDGQLEEAVRFNQRLEEELRAANREAQQLEEAAARLQQENRQIKRKAEDARAALLSGLARVREIQGRAGLVPALQGQVRELEDELQEHRARCTCRTDSPDQEGEVSANFESRSPSQRRSPTGGDESCSGGAEEQLQRAVEGRAASDEEEEERGGGEGRCCLLELKRLIGLLRCCAKGCQSSAARQLLLHQACFHCSPLDSISPPALEQRAGRTRLSHGRAEERERSEERESDLERLLCSVGKDLQLKQEEAEMLRLELQMLETERVRLSLLEEKLADTLTLLLQLHHQNVSRRALGKILMDTLDVCDKAGHGPAHSPQVLDTLCRQIQSCELLCPGSGSPAGTGQPRGSTNPLLISC